MQEGHGTGGSAIAADGAGRRRSGKGWVAAVVAILVLAGAGAAWWLLRSDGSAEATAAEETSLAEVVLTDMESVETLSGTLGFAEGDPIGSGLAATLTSA